jgi:hypothetical protein
VAVRVICGSGHSRSPQVEIPETDVTLTLRVDERSLQQSLGPFAAGAAANAVLARAAIGGRERRDAALRQSLRVTGNFAFMTLAVPLALADRLPPHVPRLLWRAFLGAHAVHAALIALLARHHNSTGQFSALSKVGGAVGYTTIAALTGTAIAPGAAPKEPWRRQLQRAGHNVLLSMHALTIAHGYLAKGRNATAYVPLAALWLAAARGMDRTWRT